MWNFKSSFRDAVNGESWTSLPQAFKDNGFISAGFGPRLPRSIRLTCCIRDCSALNAVVALAVAAVAGGGGGCGGTVALAVD